MPLILRKLSFRCLSIQRVANICQVSRYQVMHWLEDGGLEFYVPPAQSRKYKKRYVTTTSLRRFMLANNMPNEFLRELALEAGEDPDTWPSQGEVAAENAAPDQSASDPTSPSTPTAPAPGPTPDLVATPA